MLPTPKQSGDSDFVGKRWLLCTKRQRNLLRCCRMRLKGRKLPGRALARATEKPLLGTPKSPPPFIFLPIQLSLYFFFCEELVQVLCPFKKWNYYIFLLICSHFQLLETNLLSLKCVANVFSLYMDFKNIL